MALTNDASDEYFATLLNTVKIYMDIDSISFQVVDVKNDYDIIERTLPGYSAGSYTAGRVIQIKLGLYEDIKEIYYQRILDDTLLGIKGFRDDSHKEDFLYSPDDGITKYRVNLTGQGSFILEQPEKTSKTLRMRLIFKGTL